MGLPDHSSAPGGAVLLCINGVTVPAREGWTFETETEEIGTIGGTPVLTTRTVRFGFDIDDIHLEALRLILGPQCELKESTMSNNDTLPDLSSWYEVPIDADIPGDTQYAFIARSPGAQLGMAKTLPDGFASDERRSAHLQFFTERKLEATKPELPTKLGSVIYNVELTGSSLPAVTGKHAVLADEGTWYLCGWGTTTAGRIASFSLTDPMRDPMDEDDKSLRVDREGDTLCWSEFGQRWEWYSCEDGTRLGGTPQLSDVEQELLPLTFLEEGNR